LSRSYPVRIPSDPAPLHGTLLLPDSAGLSPALLLVAGAGPVDRDGNLPGLANDSLRLLAEALADRGIATLRADKRGVGTSHAAAPDESVLRLDAYVRDAAHWLLAMCGDPHLSRVGLLGHGEGALIATLAAQVSPVDRLVLVAGAGVPAGPLILRQLVDAGMPAEQVAAARAIIGRLLRGETVVDVPDALAGLFRPSVQPYVTSWLLRDPVVELVAVRCPVLVVQGMADLQVRKSDALLLAAARPSADLLLIPGVNHVLKAPAEGRAANLATYAEPLLPVAAEVADGIAAFVRP